MWEVSSTLALFLYPSWVEFHLLKVAHGFARSTQASSSSTPSSLPQACLSSGRGSCAMGQAWSAVSSQPSSRRSQSKDLKGLGHHVQPGQLQENPTKGLKGKAEGGRASFLPHGHLILQPWISGTRGLQDWLGARGQGSLVSYSCCPRYQLDALWPLAAFWRGEI